MKGRLGVIVCVLLLAGCGADQRTQEVEQQKLTLDLMKAQNEQLAALTKTQNERLAALTRKEEELRGIEKKNEETLREIEAERSQLNALREQLQKAQQAQPDHAQEEASQQQAEMERQQQEIAARNRRKMPILQEVAATAAQEVDDAWRRNYVAANFNVGLRTTKEQWAAQYPSQKVAFYNDCLNYLTMGGVLEIESDENCKAESQKVAKQWVKLKSPQ